MIKIRRRRLGKWQVQSLLAIAGRHVCCHLRLIDKIKGAAKSWDRKYKKSLARAIESHNMGLAVNSPLDPNLVIILEDSGYTLVPRSTVVRYSQIVVGNVAVIPSNCNPILADDIPF
jgi:hypothetical protein